MKEKELPKVEILEDEKLIIWCKAVDNNNATKLFELLNTMFRSENGYTVLYHKGE